MKRIALITCACGITALLAGCMATSITPQGQSVVIVQSLPSQYQCTYKGEVAGSQGNWLTGGWTPNRNLALGARNELSNVVVISETLSSNDADNSLENVTHIGRAYYCR